MFALVDCNNFYASCERLFQPHLEGKPVVVLSNNDGCVIARSNEAKALGVPMGAPAYQYQPMFEKHDIAVFSANFPLYGDLSNRVMQILASYTDALEVYSIDEAFLFFPDDVNTDWHALGHQIHSHILQWTGIPVCVGFAPTKTLAKAANHIAKKFKDQTQGVHVIDSEVLRLKALRWLKIEDVWGVGRRNFVRLQSYGVRTAYDLTTQTDSFLKRQLSVTGLRLKLELQGVTALEMDDDPMRQSISVTRTFDHTYDTYEAMRERIATFTAMAAEKLRAQNQSCRTLVLFVRTNKFRTDQPQHHEQHVMTLSFATSSTMELVAFAVTALKRLYRSGHHYKRAGVTLMNFEDDRHRQLELFDHSDARHVKLMNTIDLLNHSYGQQKVRLAVQESGRVWKMKQEFLSPCYTTRLTDIITVHATSSSEIPDSSISHS